MSTWTKTTDALPDAEETVIGCYMQKETGLIDDMEVVKYTGDGWVTSEHHVWRRRNAKAPDYWMALLPLANRNEVKK